MRTRRTICSRHRGGGVERSSAPSSEKEIESSQSGEGISIKVNKGDVCVCRINYSRWWDEGNEGGPQRCREKKFKYLNCVKEWRS